MEKQEIIDLLRRYEAGQCSAEEQALVETWYLHQQPVPVISLTAAELEHDLEEIHALLPKANKVVVRQLWYKIAAAAIILITLGTGLYFYTGNDRHASQLARLHNTMIKAGGNYASLTLADGTKISLDAAVSGEVARQSGLSIEKTKSGQLVYKVKSGADLPASATAYNTIATPKGGQYEVDLPDGTKVWLNSASSLKFPLVFSGNRRQVNLEGEAYFEVTHNKEKPFIVNSERQQVEVLGTHFDVNTYADEPHVKTTLLEGSVKVSPVGSHQAVAGSSIMLKPNQQAVLDRHSLKVTASDINEAVAWKNGYFIFQNEDMESIMRKISRWYNVDVVFEGDFKDKKFEGSISRFKDVTEILRKFELTGSVYFKIDGRRITVMK
ncbi:MAG TPA: FecR domain-containing protein [Pedobacter sp.]